jgi:hypothetical protein
MLDNGTPLTTVQGWSKAHVDRLAPHWITSAEQIVGMGSAPQGIKALAQHLGVTETEMHHLIACARAALPPSVAAELDKGVDPSQRGLGALPPDEHK